MKRSTRCRSRRISNLSAMLIREVFTSPAAPFTEQMLLQRFGLSRRHVKRIMRGYRKQVLRNRKLIRHYMVHRLAILERRIERHIFDAWIPKYQGIFTTSEIVRHGVADPTVGAISLPIETSEGIVK